MEQEQLIKTIKTHIAKGDKAAEKSEQHYISAGQHLKTLKAQHDDAGGKWAEWETFLKEKIGIGKSRASELMQIADGRKTVEQVQADGANRVAKHEAKKISPLANGENTPAKPILSQVRREMEAQSEHITELEAAREHDGDLAEQLRAAEIKIIGLESEVKELKAENARLQAELEEITTTTEKQDEVGASLGRWACRGCP
jgi:phage shock protein A